MRFKLMSSGRMISDSRLRLTEDVFDDVAKKCAELRNDIENALRRLNNSESANNDRESKVLKQIEDGINKLSAILRVEGRTEDASIIKAKTKEFVDTTLSLFDGIKDNAESGAEESETDLSRAKTYLGNIRNRANGSDFSKEGIKALKNDVTAMKAAINDMLRGKTFVMPDDQKGYEDALNMAYDYIGQLQSMAKSRKEQKIHSPLIVRSLDRISAALKSGDAAIFSATVKLLCGGEFGDIIENSPYNATKVMNTAQAVQDMNDRAATDWAKEFEASEDKASFWDRYYAAYWKGHADKIRALGKAYRQECEVLGFTADTNAFIRFLKRMLDDGGFNIGREQYNAIHDSVAIGRGLTLKDLDSVAKNLDGSPLPIACRDFYAKSYDDASGYLRALSELRRLNVKEIFEEAYSNGADEALSKIARFVWPKDCDDKELRPRLERTVLYESEGASMREIMSGANAANVGIGESVRDLPLRSLISIQALLNALDADFDLSAEKTWKGDESATKLITGLRNIANDSMREAMAKAILVYLASMYLQGDKLQPFLKRSPLGDLSEVSMAVDDVAKTKTWLAQQGVGGKMSEQALAALAKAIVDAKIVNI